MTMKMKIKTKMTLFSLDVILIFAIFPAHAQEDISTEDLKKFIAIQKIEIDNLPKITVSFGLTQYTFNEDQESFLKRVDEALYQAKQSGRNRTTVV